MGLRNTWARVPAELSREELERLAPELEQLSLLQMAALPQKKKTIENSRGDISENKISEVKRELGPAILQDVDFYAAKERGEGLPAVERQSRGVDDLEASLESFRREPQPPERIDWSPLLRFSERLGARPTSTKYVPPSAPPTALERKQIELKLQDLIQRRRESEAMNFLKAISTQKIPQPVVGTVGTVQGTTQKEEEKKSATASTPTKIGNGTAKPKLNNILKEDQFRKAQAIASVVSELDDYINTFKKSGYVITGPTRALLDQKKSKISMGTAHAEGMGALQGPEFKMLDKRLGKLTGVSGTLQGNIFRGGVKGEVRSLRDLQNQAVKEGREYLEVLKADPVYGQDVYKPQLEAIESKLNRFSAEGRKAAKSAPDFSKMTNEELKKYLGQ